MATPPLKAWIQSALRASEIIKAARHPREGLAAASESLGIGISMIQRQLDLLDYVTKYARLEDVQAAQTKLEIFRTVERADPVRGRNLREAVLADRLKLKEIQMELDEAKIREGLRKPVPMTLDQVLDLCSRDLPVLDRLRPPVDSREPEDAGLWIGVDLDWSLVEPGEDTVKIWCAMISMNIGCACRKQGSFFDFMLRVIAAGVRYRAVSVVLASEQERRTLTTELEWITKGLQGRFFLHVVGGKKEENTMVCVGGSDDPFAVAVVSTADPLAT